MKVLEVNIEKKSFPSPTNQGQEVVAIEGLNFSVPKGEFTCILGPSGSGKTTLLQLISGLDIDYEGKILVSGSLPSSGPPLGYMFQSARLMPWLSVIENINLIASESAKNEGIPEILLDRMELGSFFNTYPNRLSGGMRRRVALARAFVNSPPLLLLDEPFISLDAPVANRLRQLLLELWKEQGSTIIFVTHDLREAIQLGDRIMFFSSSPGRLLLDHKIELPRPRSSEGKDVEDYRRSFLDEHPAILEGVKEMEAAAAKGVDIPSI